jgi:hypothetical protein
MCEGLLAVEREQIMTAYAHAVANFTAARREKRDPASLRVARLERLLEAARRDGSPLNDLAIDLANAREDVARGAPQPDRFIESSRCYGLGDEAWVLRVRQPKVAIPPDGAPRDWSLEGEHELVYVDRKAAVTGARLLTDSTAPPQTLLNETPLLVDLNGNGHMEILWVVWVHPATTTVAFAYRDQQVVPFSEVSVPGVLHSLEVKREGRHGILSYAVALDDGSRCLGDAEIEHDPTNYSSPLLAEVVDGKLLLDSPLIRENLRNWCPERPPTKIAGGDDVLCARLHGTPSASLLRQIERDFVEAPCDPDAGAAPQNKRHSTEYTAMTNASRWKPPFVIR